MPTYVHRALIDAYGIPADDRFQLVQQLEKGELVYDADYRGIHRTDDVVFVDIVAGNWRDTAKKKALFKAIVGNLARAPVFAPRTCSSSCRRTNGTNGLSATASPPTSRISFDAV